MMEDLHVKQLEAIQRALALPWWAFIRRRREERIIYDCAREGHQRLLEIEARANAGFLH